MRVFGGRVRRRAFERDVRFEMDLLTKLHGDDAGRVAAEKAARPNNRTLRRKVLLEAARRLGGQPGQASLLSRLIGRIRQAR